MRGKHVERVGDFPHVRIIPAHAGQTRGPRMECRRGPDHPRACGANGSYLGIRNRFHGSSPRMRGKRRACGIKELSGRIIPAHAGQTTVV